MRDLQIHPRENDLLVATHGRGLYILDDISWLQNLHSAVTTDATLFDLRTATNWNLWNREGNVGQKVWRGENPPNGAIITYYLKSPQRASVTVTEKNGGRVVDHVNATGQAGINRVTWSLSYEAPVAAAGGRGTGGRGAGGGRGARGGGAGAGAAAAGGEEAPPAGGRGGRGGRGGGGIDVLPGVYTVTLVAGSQRVSKDVTVEGDPRFETTPAALTQQIASARQMQELGLRVNGIVNAVDDLTRQLTATQSALESAPDSTNKSIPAALTEITGTLGDLRHFRDSVLARPLNGLGYRQYPRLREEVQSVSGMVARGARAPTAGELLRAGELKNETDQAQARLDALVAGRIGKINSLLAGMPRILAPPIRVVQ